MNPEEEVLWRLKVNPTSTPKVREIMAQHLERQLFYLLSGSK